MRTLSARPRRRVARALAPIAVLALVSTVLAGCGDGGDDDSDGGSETATLSQDQADTAVLQPENFSGAWQQEEDDDEDGTAPGCMGEIDAITEDLEEAAEADVTFEYGEAGLPSVDSGLSAYDDEDEITGKFDEVQEALSTCTSVTGTDDDGLEWNLTLTADEDVTYDGVDDQINLTADGTLANADGQEVQVYVVSTMARIGANVAVVTTTDLEDPSAGHESWAQIGVERAVAVIDGEEPAETTAPDPS